MTQVISGFIVAISYIKQEHAIMYSIRVNALLAAISALALMVAATTASAEMEDGLVTSSLVAGSATTADVVAQSQRFDEPE